MRPLLILVFAITFMTFGCKSDKNSNSDMDGMETQDSLATETTVAPVSSSEIVIHPISHATMVLEYDNTVIYVDPVGSAEAFANLPKPKIILVTDIHGDHFDLATLEALYAPNVMIVVPKAVAAKLPATLKPAQSVMSNGQNISMNGKSMQVAIEAIPMYNLRQEALKFHEKGRGNGYILTLGGKKIYISGDTEDIPEMRQLKDIDMAFVCMNLPYTMTVDSAASAVLDFKPKKVYPYHYRGSNGYSDVEKFKTLVNEGNGNIEVVLLDWYPNR